MFNLLDNAVKYTPEGGSIDVTVEQWEMYVKIDISDTGLDQRLKKKIQLLRLPADPLYKLHPLLLCHRSGQQRIRHHTQIAHRRFDLMRNILSTNRRQPGACLRYSFYCRRFCVDGGFDADDCQKAVPYRSF